MYVHHFYYSWANIHGLTLLEHTSDWQVIHNVSGEYVLYQCPKYPHILLFKHFIPLKMVLPSIKAVIRDYIICSPFNSFYPYIPLNTRFDGVRDNPNLLGYVFLDEYTNKGVSLLEYDSKNITHQKGIRKCGLLPYINFYHLFYWYKLLPPILIKDIRYLVFKKLVELELCD